MQEMALRSTASPTLSWDPPAQSHIMDDWGTGSSRRAGSAVMSGWWLSGIPQHLLSWGTSQIRTIAIYLTMALIYITWGMWVSCQNIGPPARSISAFSCAKVHNAKMAELPSLFCLSVLSYWQLLMKVIFCLISVNELCHYTPECGCESPASASVTACSGASLPGLAVLWNCVPFGYESSQSVSHMV